MIENCRKAKEESIEDMDPWEELREEERLSLYASSLPSNFVEGLLTSKVCVYKAFCLMHLLQAHAQRVRQYSPALSIRWHIRLTWVAAQSNARSTPEERNMRCSCSKNTVRHSYIFVTFPFLLFFHLQNAKLGSGY